MDKSELVLKKEKAELLESLDIHLPENEAEEIAEKLLEHFNKTIIETLVTNLTEDQAKEFSDSLNSEDENMGALVEMFAARTPGLLDKIEGALAREFEVIKTAYAK